MTSSADSTTDGLKDKLKEYGSRADEPGKRYILKSLTTELKGDPWSTISTLQAQLSLGSPAASMALQFLNTLGVSNLDAHVSLFEVLRERVELVVARLDQAQLLTLLKECVMFLSFKELKIVPLCIAKRLTTIPAPILRMLVDRGLLQELPVSVRRQAWEMSPESFAEALSSVSTPTGVAEMIGTSDTLFKHFSNYAVKRRASGTMGGLLVKVLLTLEGRRYEKLHDVASLVERCLRQAKVDSTAVVHFHAMLKGMIVSQAAAEQRAGAASAGAGGPIKVSQKTLLAAWQSMQEADNLSIFQHPVTDAIAPNYSNVIKQPMDLSTMKQKITSNQYGSVADLENDLVLMLSNCKVYNGEVSVLGKHADKVLAKWKKVKGKFMTAGPVSAAVAAGAITNVSRPAAGQALLVKPVAAPAPKVIAPAPAVVPPVPTTPAVVSTEERLLKELAEAWKFITKADIHAIFAAPVTLSGYSAVIKNPMDMSLIKSRIKSHAYKGLEDLDKDLKLMFRNCRTFNGPDSPITKEGERIYLSWKDSESYKRLKAFAPNPPPPAPVVVAPVAPPVAPKKAAPTPKKAVVVESSDDISSIAYLHEGEEVLREAYRFVEELDMLKYFGTPVTDDIAPEYSKVIKRPMDLSAIRARLDSGGYSTLKEVHEDLMLMWNNCKEYNGAASDLSKYAEILRKYWKIYYEDLQRDDASASLRERFSLINGDESVALGRLEEDPSIATKGWTVLAVDFLTKADKEKYFDKVPTEAEAPGYAKLIPKKMSLALMRKKVIEKAYATAADMHADALQIALNVCSFNAFGTVYFNAGVRFLAKWLVLYHLLEHLQAQPASSAPAAVKRSRPEEEAPTVTKKARTEEALPSTPMGLAQSGYYAANDPIKLPSVLSVSQLKGQAQTVLATVWEYLSGIDKDKQFARPISDPNYLASIDRPMDLSTMKVKLDRGRYASLSAFGEDVQLMADNALTYHSQGSRESKAAMRMAYAWNIAHHNGTLAAGGRGEEKELDEEHTEQSAVPMEVVKEEPAAAPAPVRSPAKPAAPAPVPVPAAKVEPAPAPAPAPVPVAVAAAPAHVAQSSSEQLQAAARSVSQGMAVAELPPVSSTSSFLQYSLLMLTDSGLQKLLIKYLVQLLKRAHLSSLRNEEMVTLPYEDAEARFLLQLIQLGFTVDVQLLGVCETIMRVYLPHVMLHPSASAVDEVLRAYPLPAGGLDGQGLKSFLEQFVQCFVEN